MKNPSLFLSILSLSLVGPAFADTFVLKDGTRLEAKILSETPEAYLLEVQVTKSIKDEKTVPKADVKEIVREKLDETAYEKLKGLVPTPDLLTSDEYDTRILQITKFLKDHPKSAKVADANAMLAILKTEGTAVQSGGFKLNGKIIPAADYKANAYEIDAKVQEVKIRELMMKGDILSALRGLSKMDSEFGKTSSHASLAPVKRQALQGYKTQISGLIRTFEAREAERKAGLARMSGEARANTEQAIAEEDAQFDRRFKAEKEARQFWAITNPFHMESLEDAQNAIDQASNERGSDDSAEDGGKLYRDAWSAIQSWDGKDETKQAVEDAIEKVKDLEVPSKYVSFLSDAAKAKGIVDQ